MSKRPLSDTLRRRWDAQIRRPLEHSFVGPLRARVNARRIYDPVFVGGASGGGTSFLAVSVGQHFDCSGVIFESNLQVDRESFLYVPDIDLFDSVADYQRAMGPHPDWSVDQATRDMLHMYRSYCWGRSPVVIDKGPDTNLLRAEFLARCFRGARFLLIYRDPAANIEGLRRKWRTFRNDTLEESIRFYREIHERFLEAAETFPERVALVDYDAMVADYEKTLAAIGERLGLAPTARRRRLPTRANVEGMGIRNVHHSQIGVVKDANQRAIERLGPGEADVIRRALTPLHERMRSARFNV